MIRKLLRRSMFVGAIALTGLALEVWAQIGKEVSVAKHLNDGDEFTLSLSALIEHGKNLFVANWTSQEGGGRPLTKGNGNALSDPANPLVFPRNTNRISAPDANSCAGCHTQPFGIPGGGGDMVANVFVLGQRFDFATFDPFDPIQNKGTLDERGIVSTLDNIANSRATLGMFGSGFIEMLARQMTARLQEIRDSTPTGGCGDLMTKGISFGRICRDSSGNWDTTQVERIAAPSLTTSGPSGPPSLIIRPFHQAGNVISIRQFTNNAFNHHHGIQSTERFGIGTDTDGDGFVNELTRADVSAATIFQVVMAVPGRVIPNDSAVESAVRKGEDLFASIGCTRCHVPSLPLDNKGWIYKEPNPYNPSGNLRPGDAPTLEADLTSSALPSPRLKPDKDGVVQVPAYTDLRLHDITNGPGDPNMELLDMNHAAGSLGFFAGNGKFLTRKLWGAANEPPYFHHGKFTTMREAILAHAGEAINEKNNFTGFSAGDKDCVVDFLKTLQVLPAGSKHLIVDEKGNHKRWP